jgi:hypothetical protein
VSTRVVYGIPEADYRVPCDGIGVTILVVNGENYIRDPQGTFTGKTDGRYQATASLPPGAMDTGLRHDGIALWRAAGDAGIYRVADGVVERLPQEKGERRPCA